MGCRKHLASHYCDLDIFNPLNKEDIFINTSCEDLLLIKYGSPWACQLHSEAHGTDLGVMIGAAVTTNNSHDGG